MSTFKNLVTGGADYGQVMKNAGMLQGPDAANYGAFQGAQQVTRQPIAGQADQGKATQLIAQTAQGNGPSLARANMQAGLSSTNNAIAAQAATNQGNVGQGSSQRNLLNAQAAANNNYVNQAGMASAAEQLGAQANYASAANAQAHSALAGRQQQLGAYGLQAQQQMAYDQGQQNYGINKANIGLQATNADAKQLGQLGQFAGNIAQGAAMAAMSDEKSKEGIDKSAKATGKIEDFLNAFQPSAQADSAMPQAPSGDGLLRPGQGIQLMGGAPAGPTTGLAQGLNIGGMGKAMKGHQAALGATGLEGHSAGQMAAAGMNLGQANSALAALGPMAAKSDERSKQNIGQPSGGQLEKFMGAMEPSTFQYKDQSYSPGQHLGVMAQDVDDSQIGAGLIEQQPDGMKAINVPKALGASLASLAHLNERIDELEKSKGAKRGKKSA